jgi:sugar lactone lactonase YvrE
MDGLVRIGTQRDILGECPLWSLAEQALYWVDIRAPAIRRLDWASQTIQNWTMPGLVGSIAFAEDGRLVVALSERIALFDTLTADLQTIARISDPFEGHRFNDGRCDRQGRFWVGSMHNITREPVGVLYRLDPVRGLVATQEGICIPNSLAWSPDGRTMYFADSLKFTIFAHDFYPESGEIGPARIFARTTQPAFADGSTIDEEGFLWNAEFFGSRLVRYAPDGQIDRIVKMPLDRPTCCAFGGPDLATLFITTTSQNMTSGQLAAQPLAGGLFAYRPGVRGIEEPRCNLPDEINLPCLNRGLCLPRTN